MLPEQQQQQEQRRQQGGEVPPLPRLDPAAAVFLESTRQSAAATTIAPKEQQRRLQGDDARDEQVVSSSRRGDETPTRSSRSRSRSSTSSRSDSRSSSTRTTVLPHGGRPSGGHEADHHRHQRCSSAAVLDYFDEDEDGNCWPLLPGAAAAVSTTSLRSSSSSCWLSGCCLRRREFALGDAGSWPSLAGSPAVSSPAGGISLAASSSSSLSSGLSSSSTCSSSLTLSSSLASSSKQAGVSDVGPTRGSTQQQRHKHEAGGYAEQLRRGCSSSSTCRSVGISKLWTPKPSWERSTSRGWMKLPPIVTVDEDVHSKSSSSSNKRGFGEVDDGVQQQQKKNQDQQQQQKKADHGMSPVLLMLNTDFIVTSPVRENLLLTLALSQKQGEECDHCCDEASSSSRRVRKQVLVGRFEALSSFLRFGLSRDAKRVVTECNAGGTSTISESLSVEYFVRRFQARDVVTEMEVEYCAMNWKKVDYICNLYGQRVGVSVTRAMSYPNPQDFSPQMAYRLLYKKLFGLVVARHGVTERHSFSRCILHVWCETRTTAEILEAQYRDVSEELEIADDVIMVLTVAEGWHARPIFYESCLTST